MKKNSFKIVIAFILFLASLGALGSLGAYIYFKTNIEEVIVTDENKVAFYNYISKVNFYDLIELNNFSDVLYKIETMPNKTESNISINTSENKIDNYDLNKLNIECSIQNNPGLSLQYADINFKYASNDIFRVQEIKDNNKFAIKSDDIVVKYLGLNLSNVKEVLQRLGIIFTNKIPNDFNDPKYSKLLSLDAEFIKNRKALYENIIFGELNNNRFEAQQEVEIEISGKKYKTEAYIATLTEKDVKIILNKLTENILSDDDVINMIAEKYNMIYDDNITSETIKNKIIEQVNNIKAELNSNNEKMKIGLYIYEGNLLKIRCDIYNYADIEIDLPKKDEISITFIKKDSNGFNISLTRNDRKKINFEIGWIKNREVNKKFKIEESINGDSSLSNLINQLNVEYKENEKWINVNIETKIDFEDVSISELTEENCIFVDKLSDEDLKEIKNQIISQFIKVYKEKQEKIDLINRNSQNTVIVAPENN